MLVAMVGETQVELVAVAVQVELVQIAQAVLAVMVEQGLRKL
jgi:hypothetical protein